jgi:AraC family transcriptional regulator
MKQISIGLITLFVLICVCRWSFAQSALPPLNVTVKIATLPAYHVAYVEYVGDFEGNAEIYDVLLAQLLKWAMPNNLWDFPAITKLFQIYPDNEATPKEKRRLWMGITVPENTSVPEGIKKLVLPSRTYTVGSFELSNQDFGRAWGYLYGEWIPQNGYIPAEGYSFEIKKNDSDDHPEHKHVVDICIPVRKSS